MYRQPHGKPMTPRPETSQLPPGADATQGPDADPEQHTALLNDRVPGQAVIGELMAVRQRDLPRSALGRIFGTDPLSADSRPWYKGALGEIAVGRILTRLGAEWTVLHAVPVGSGTSDIDHVLIGPAGVFTLNTKNHAGQSVWVAGRSFMVSGKKQRHIPNAVHEAARAARLLTAAAGEAVDVTGLLVVVEPKRLTVREKPSDVAVVTDGQLLRWLGRRKPVLTPEQVTSISAAAALPGTWHKKPPAADDSNVLQYGFNALRTLVDRARRRRAAWALALTAALLVALANVAPVVAAAFVQFVMPR